MMMGSVGQDEGLRGLNFAAHLKDRTSDVLQVVLEQSQDAILLVNDEGRLEYVNPNGLEALRLTGSGTTTDVAWDDLWCGEARERAALAMARARDGRKARFEAQRISGDDVSVWGVSVSPISDDTGEPAHFLVIARELEEVESERRAERSARRDAERHADQADAVAKEMRHRFKNQLAVVGAVLKLQARHSSTPAEVATKFERKLAALARAQDLLVESHIEPVTARTALTEVVQASGAGEQVSIAAIPDCQLPDESVQNIALILGELQTNSLKYGALSEDDREIRIAAELQGHELMLTWTEDLGAETAPPTSSGAGTKLIERLGSVSDRQATIAWEPPGLVVTFYVRVRPAED